MTIGLRLVALLIDLMVCAGIDQFIGDYLDAFLPTLETPHIPFVGMLSLTSNVVIMLIYFTLLTAATGRTVGKWICRLRVVDRNNERPRFWLALGREALKLLALLTQIGGYIALGMLVFYNRPAWYDQLCETDVEFIGNLSSTQKNWRKSYKRF